MPLPKERYCKIQAPGCQRKFIPKRFWQEVCENEECHREYHRRYSQTWRRKNPEQIKDYNREYAAL